MARVIRYMIRATGNAGQERRVLSGEYETKAEAKKRLKKILSKPQKGKTSFRNAQSGIGINNPRIIKRRVLR